MSINHIPSKVTIHCSATRNGERVDISEIRKWHIARGFEDVGYHMVIQPDGEVQNGRYLNVMGAHVENHNQGNIGICLIGKDKFSARQFHALRYKLDGLKLAFDSILKWDLITCHYQYDTAQKQGKTCPNLDINRLLIWYYLQEESALEPYLMKIF